MTRVFDTPIFTGDQSIDRVLSAGLPVALVFVDGAPGPAIQDEMNRIARENAGKLLVAGVRAEDNPVTARRYEVSRTPAVVTIREGKVQSKAETLSAADLERHVAYLLGKGPRPEPPRVATGTERAQQGAGAARPAPNGSARAASAGASAGARPAETAAAAGEGHPRVVTDATFDQEVVRSAEPVLVDFWAPWCGPCKMVEPAVEKLARELAGRLRVAKVNVDENPQTAMRFGVQSIPTMLVMKNGQVADRWMGAMPEAVLRSRVTKVLEG